ncbi:MAG: rapid alkalinization factor family protein [Myxococcales bacterium]
MTKLILALCLSASALVGCGGDPGEDVAGEGDTAGSNAAEGQELNATAIRYISYAALNGNRVPPCKPNSQVMDTATHQCIATPANVWTRGCSAATRCRRQ